jgi:hypothetical protein
MDKNDLALQRSLLTHTIKTEILYINTQFNQ